MSNEHVHPIFREILNAVAPHRFDRTCDCAECEAEGLKRERAEAANYDPTPYCSYGHRTKAECDCGPIADNE